MVSFIIFSAIGNNSKQANIFEEVRGSETNNRIDRFNGNLSKWSDERWMHNFFSLVRTSPVLIWTFAGMAYGLATIEPVHTSYSG